MNIYQKDYRNIIKNFIKITIILNLLIGSHALSGFTELYGYTYVNIIKYIMILFSYILGLLTLGLIVMKRKTNIVINNIFIFIFILVLLGLSIIGSTSVSVSIKGIMFLAFDVVLCISVVSFFNSKEIFNTILLSFFIIFIVNIIFTILYPNVAFSTYDIRYSFNYVGSFPQKNILGIFLSLFCILLFIKIVNSKKCKRLFWIITYIIVFSFLIITNSMTSLLCTIVSTILIIVSNYKGRNINTINLGLIINILFYIVLNNIDLLKYFLENILNRDATLSGRTDIWNAIIELISFRPYVGYGFVNIWDNEEIVRILQNKVGFKFIGSHNGILEIILQIGIIGLLLLLIVMFIIPSIKLNKYKYNMDDLMMLIHSFYIYFLLYMITERVFISNDFQTFILILFSVYLTNKKILNVD